MPPYISSAVSAPTQWSAEARSSERTSPPYVKAAHLPVSFVGANFIGLRRRGFSTEKITEIQNIFRILFQSGYGYGRACDIVMEQFPQTPERDEIVGFIRSSKRGILKPYNSAFTDVEE